MYSSRRTSHISSRLARHEQKKALRQTIVFGGLALVLLLAFFFFILPQSVRLLGGLTGGSGSPFDTEDTLAPQVPVLDAPVSATPSATLTVTGIGEAKSEVILVVNGNEQNRTSAGDDGRFEFDVMLDDGENAISFYAIDASNNESASSQTYLVIRDATPPKLEIAEPTDGQQVEQRKNQVIRVVGTSDPNTRITVNGRVTFAKSDGSFSSSYQLQEGENLLVIEAVDDAGNTAKQELKVNFRL